MDRERLRAALLVVAAVVLVVVAALAYWRPSQAKPPAQVPGGTGMMAGGVPGPDAPGGPARTGELTGRVVEAETGKPVAGIQVVTGLAPQFSRDVTDDQGRYHLRRVAVGPATVLAQDNERGWMPASAGELEVKAKGTTHAPDTKLQRGGWIAGTVDIPDVAPDEHMQIDELSLRSETGPAQTYFCTGQLPKSPGEHTFRTAPLPPARYTLTIQVSFAPRTERGPRRLWRAEIRGVEVRVGEETRGLVVSPQPIPAYGAMPRS